MNDNVQSRSERLVKSRVAPLLYVVDAQLNILFASAGGSGSELPVGIAGALRAAVRLVQTGDSTEPRTYEGRLVRTERLTGRDGSECYAVFFERLAVSQGDIDASSLEDHIKQATG